MLDEKDLQLIQSMIDAQSRSFDEKLDAQSRSFDEKLDAQSRSFTQQLNLLIENVFQPQFALLAEGQQMILEKMVPSARVERLEEEVTFLKSIVFGLNEDVQKLKKAN